MPLDRLCWLLAIGSNAFILPFNGSQGSYLSLPLVQSMFILHFLHVFPVMVQRFFPPHNRLVGMFRVQPCLKVFVSSFFLFSTFSFFLILLLLLNEIDKSKSTSLKTTDFLLMCFFPPFFFFFTLSLTDLSFVFDAVVCCYSIFEQTITSYICHMSERTSRAHIFYAAPLYYTGTYTLL